MLLLLFQAGVMVTVFPFPSLPETLNCFASPEVTVADEGDSAITASCPGATVIAALALIDPADAVMVVVPALVVVNNPD